MLVPAAPRVDAAPVGSRPAERLRPVICFTPRLAVPGAAGPGGTIGASAQTRVGERERDEYSRRSSEDALAGTVERVGVIGGGIMGSGIAEVAARNGCDVILCEVSEAAAENGLARIRKSLARRSGRAS